MFRRTLSSLRWYAVNMWHWWGQRHLRHAPAKRIVRVDLHENHAHRYLHILVLFLQDQGYSVVFRHRWRFIGCWASYDMFRRSAGFRIDFFSSRAHGGALITDRPTDAPHFLLDHDYFTLPGREPTGVRIPMPMVDSQYIAGKHLDPPVDPELKRRRAVFFFGNMDPAAYRREEPSVAFNCYTRAELLTRIRQRFAVSVHEPRTIKEIDGALDRDIVLLGRHHAYIPPRELLGALARFDFFLAPSGVVMPLCHNLIEAMVAGCIPILQHAHLMDPPLHDGMECLSFNDENGLEQALVRMRSLDEAEVRRMRRAVLNYCAQHLTPTAVIAKLENAGWRGPLHMNAELTSVLLFREKMKASGIDRTQPLAAAD